VASKLEVNFALCHEDIWVSGGVPAHILFLALDGDEWLAEGPMASLNALHLEKQ